jgi:hypothetical protein
MRFAPDYFRMMADYIRSGHIGGHDGNAGITEPRPRFIASSRQGDPDRERLAEELME